MTDSVSCRRVLLVEDDDDLRATLAEMLGEAGFDVVQAANGESALEQLRTQEAPQAIILDLMMPGMNGWEFRLHQRRDPALAATPVVVISADVRAEARAIDADLYVSKPFEMKKLLDGLGRVIALGERRRFAEKLAREDRLASIATLAAGLAHEINNPLMAVLGSIELVQRMGKANAMPALMDVHLRTAHQAALHVQSLIRNVSNFARPDDPLEVLDLRPVLEAALSMSSVALLSRANVDTRHDPVPPVRASRGHLLQVFVNLLDNAAHALVDAATPVLRTRTYLSDDGQAVVEISDSGSGIAPDHLGRIFDPFFTTRSPGQGTGLGLSICHSFVTRFRGSIQVESEVGVGSTFRVILPPAASGMQLRLDVHPDAITPPPAADSEPPSQRRTRVLVIDDEPMVCSVLEHVLSDCDVTVVSSGRDALDRLSSDQRYDVVLCDLNLTDISGLDVLDTALEIEPGLRQSFCLMTGGTRNQAQADRVAGCGVRVLAKPFELDLLLSVVEESAKLSRARKRKQPSATG